MKKKLLLLDGHSLAYRAFFALPVENFATTTGQHTNAIYGFASMIINLIRDEKPTHIATAFDVSRKTFRSEKFPEYKANRASTPDEFRSQIVDLSQILIGFLSYDLRMDRILMSANMFYRKMVSAKQSLAMQFC